MNSVIKINDGVVVEVKQVKLDYILHDNEFIISEYNVDCLGKTYNPIDKTFSEYVPSQEEVERQAKEWRDSELFRTDSLMLLPDYPYTEQLTLYRQALRDWPSTPEFPSVRPIIGGL
jgi:hypothetical protein